jgi:hypothetical protein
VWIQHSTLASYLYWKTFLIFCNNPMMTWAWLWRTLWSLNVEQCRVNFVVFYFLQLCCPCDHFQIFVGFAIFNFMMCKSFDGCVACGEHWSWYFVCCFVICMQVWVFKSFNYFLLPFPISLIFLVYCRLIVNSTHFVHFFPFYPFLSIFVHFYPFCPNP